jgi:hypothetical protein
VTGLLNQFFFYLKRLRTLIIYISESKYISDLKRLRTLIIYISVTKYISDLILSEIQWFQIVADVLRQGVEPVNKLTA